MRTEVSHEESDAAERFQAALAPGYIAWHDGRQLSREEALTQIVRGLRAANADTTILLCLNSKGRAIAAVGPFKDDAEARYFFDTKASRAYHGFTLVDLVAPSEY